MKQKSRPGQVAGNNKRNQEKFYQGSITMFNNITNSMISTIYEIMVCIILVLLRQ